MPTPLSLTDQEMAAVLDAAAPINPARRSAFLEDLAGELAKCPEGIGLGGIHRIAREIQHRYIDVVGRHARGRL